MGEYKSGPPIFLLSLYFMVFFILVLSMKSASAEHGTADMSGLRLDDPGFQAMNPENGSIADSVSASDNFNWKNIKDTFSFMLGFGIGSDLGVPSFIAWAFSFVFFYLPFMILLFSIYMALPFMH